MNPAFQDKCPVCRYAPLKPTNPHRLCDDCHVDLVQRAVTAIRGAVIAELSKPPELDCCLACGCLVLPDEHCPGCKAARLQGKAS